MDRAVSAALTVTMAPGRVLDLTGCVLDGTGHDCALKVMGDGGTLILPAETWIGGLDLSEAGPDIGLINQGLTTEGRGHKYGIRYGLPPARVRPDRPVHRVRHL